MSQPPYPSVPDDRVPDDVVPDDRAAGGWSGFPAAPPPPAYGYPGQPPGLNQAVGPPGTPTYSLPPNNYLVWAILSTLVGCLPLGVVSIVKATSVNTLWFQGRYGEALQASRSARNWALASAGVALAGFLFYFAVIISLPSMQ